MNIIVTMSQKKVLLSKAILGVDNCTLCLENIGLNGFSVDDEVFVKISNEEGSSLLFIEIISFLLNIAEQQSTITTKLCKECAKNAISSYTFIKKCQNSRTLLQNAIENIESSIHNVCVEKEVANTLFIATNTNNCTCSIYYDKHSEVKTTRDALKRFKAQISKKIKNKKSKQVKLLQPPIEDNDFPDLEFSNSGNEQYDKDGKTICEYCSRTFPNSKGLRAHYVRVHAPKDHKCNECPKTYGAAHLLKLHKTESHMTVMCTECGKTYSNLHSLKMHSFSHTKLACHICGREYKTRNSYRKHIKSKICTQEQGVKRTNIERKYTCDICDKSYAHKGTLQAHINFEHENGKSFTCGWCNKKFAAQSRLKSHIVKHTRERNFTCEICGGKFVTKEALLYHTRIHTGETPYPCLHCDQRFLSASRRMDHMRRKHMGPTLECVVCNSKFKTPSSLAKHKRRHFNPNSRLFTQTVCESVEV